MQFQKIDPIKNKPIRKIKVKFFEAIQEVFVDHNDSGHNLPSIFGKLFCSRSTKYLRFLALIQLIHCVLPTRLRTLIRKRYNYSQQLMPFDTKQYCLKHKFNKGEAYNVFLLEPVIEGLPNLVLKIYRLSKGGNVAELIRIANWQKQEYLLLKNLYQDIPELIPDEHYLLLNGPDNGTPVVAMIQTFESRRIRDIFMDFTPEQLERLIQKHPRLRNQIDAFVKITGDNPQLIDNELDILGKNNLAVVGEDSDPHLLFLDPHFRENNPDKQQIRQQILQRIQFLADRLQESK